MSEEEYALLETAAQADGRTLGEWCREAILRGGAYRHGIGDRNAELACNPLRMRLLGIGVPSPLLQDARGQISPKPLALCGSLKIPDATVTLLRDSRERFDFYLLQRKPFALNPGGLKSLVKKPLDVEALADAKD